MRADVPHLTVANFGTASGIFFLAFAAFQIPAAQAAVRYSARRMLVLELLGWGLLSAATSSVRSVGELFVLRFLLGMAEAGFYPTAMMYISQFFPGDAAGTAIAIFMTGAGGGAMASSISSGVILDHLDGIGGWSGWRWLFLLQALPAIALSPLVFFFLPDSPSQLRFSLSHSERCTVSAVFRSQTASATPPPIWALRRTLRLRSTWLFAIAQFALQMATYTSLFYFPTLALLAFPQLTFMQFGPLNASITLMIWIGSPMVASWADVSRGPRRRLFTAWGLIAFAGSTYVVAGFALMAEVSFGVNLAARVTAGGVVTTACLVATIVSVSLSFAPLWSLHHELQPQALRPISIALTNCIGNLGAFFGPSLLGTLHDEVGSPCGPAPAHTPADSRSRIAMPLNTSIAPKVGVAVEADCLHRYGAGILILGILICTCLLGSTSLARQAGALAHADSMPRRARVQIEASDSPIPLPEASEPAEPHVGNYSRRT